MRRRDFIAGIGGAAVAWPVPARAQQRTVPVIGYLSGGAPVIGLADNILAAFRAGLAEQNYFEGRNLDILYRYAENHFDRLPSLASELVQHGVAIIASIAGGSASILAAKSATATIPIVFVTGADPVDLGLVKRLDRPESNLTGATYFEHTLIGKRLELLHETVPSATSIGFLVNPTNPTAKDEISQAETAARILSVRLVVLNASTVGEIEGVFANAVAQRVGALSLGPDIMFNINHAHIIRLAALHRMPVIYDTRENVEDGGLMGYAANPADAARIAGSYAGRILKGAKPAELPVQQSTRIEMVLNLKTAKALGIEVPTATLLRATEVIE